MILARLGVWYTILKPEIRPVSWDNFLKITQNNTDYKCGKQF
jgi:hypothetical protein